MNKVHDKGYVDLLLSFHFFSFFKALLIIGAPPPSPVSFIKLSGLDPRGFFQFTNWHCILYWMNLYGHEQYAVSLIIFKIFSSSSIQVFVRIGKTWSYANANSLYGACCTCIGPLKQFKDCFKRPKTWDFLI